MAEQGGLLDFLNSPGGMGLLSAVGAGLAGARRGGTWNAVGSGLLGGVQGYAQGQDLQRQSEYATQRGKLFDMQAQQLEQQQAAAKAEAERKAAQQASQQAFLQRLNPNQMRLNTALGGGGGPMSANAAKLPAEVDPQKQMMWEAAQSGVIPASDYIKTFMPDTEAFTLSPGQVRYKGGQVVAKGQDAVPELPSSVREYNFAKDQGFSGSFQDWVMSQKRAAAPSVAVNMSDPTAVAKAALSFQKDFRDATKPSYARAAAYNAMLEASRDPSAKGDLTMVYSLVKAYDPESVVREGEIDLLNANRSVPDRIKGYAQRLATGQSLLPQERQDMLEQARTLSFTDYKRSRNDIKAFRDNAGRLGLDPELYAPDPYQGVDFGPRRLGGSSPAMPAKGGAPKGPATIPTQDEIAAELARRGIK